MSSIKVMIDLEKDARNYWSAINHNTHSSMWKEQLDKIDFDFSILLGVSEEKAYPLLKSYLDNLWTKEINNAKVKQNEMAEKLFIIKDQIFKRIEILTKHALYRKDFTIFLTTLNRGPYWIEQGYTRSGIYRPNYIKSFVHELLHFQTIHYYKDSMMDVLNDNKKFEDIKESLTFLLNCEFEDLIDGYDKGYPQHQELRKKLEEYRVNSDKDLDKLIEYALTCV